ncbi:hypothetical protein [Emticicia sp. SJ17W-69]|uniref:hypothetical protein n=1 Tax=Emticicia sp. SJ17W-69 TaxID=3421657 RepID=UPI003EC0538A
METLIVKPKNIEELHFVQTMLTKMRIKSEVKEQNKKKQLKKEFLDSFERRVEQVNQDLAGEIKLKNAFDLLNEL